jgi:hypothetical protein
MTKPRKILQKKACKKTKDLLESPQSKQEEHNQVRLTAKLRSKLKNVISVGQGLWRVFNSKGVAYYCKDPLLLADIVYRRKYDEAQMENLNGQYMQMYLITGRKQK